MITCIHSQQSRVDNRHPVSKFRDLTAYPNSKLLLPVSFYVPRPDEKLETPELVIPGEDPEDEPLEDDEKPVRILTEFSIFDPLHRNEMVSLAAIEEEDGVDRHFEGAGWVAADFISEDVGQEDWDVDEEEDRKVYVRLGAILRYTLDYKSENE